MSGKHPGEIEIGWNIDLWALVIVLTALSVPAIIGGVVLMMVFR